MNEAYRLPYAVSALGAFLIREAFMQISDDVVDAAGGRRGIFK